MAIEFFVYIVVLGWDDSSLVVADTFASGDDAEAYAQRVGPAKGADWAGICYRAVVSTGPQAEHHGDWPDTEPPRIVWERAPRIERILGGS